jgi:hypothetical protein
VDVNSGVKLNHTGKKERVVICCLTTEIVKVVEPVRFYEATKVHIIAYPSGSETDPVLGFYNKFLEEACKRIESLGRVKVVVHRANITDYQQMLRTIIQIVAEVRKDHGDFADIYVNLSSGTPEYIAGAMVASTQDDCLVAFSVRTKRMSMDIDDALKAYTVGSNLVGRTSEVYDPNMITTFGSERPPNKFVCCLATMKVMNDNNRSPSFNDIIDELKSDGVWDYVPEAKKTRTDESQKERMFYRRNYIDPMVARGWIVEDTVKRNRYILTKKGESVVDVYYRDDHGIIG